MAGEAPKIDNGSKLLTFISVIALLLVVFVFGRSLLNTYNKNSLKGERDTTQVVLEAEGHLKPVGLAAAAGEMIKSAVGRTGKEIYEGVCASCHSAGVLGSPKFGDKAAWEPRITKGLSGLLSTAAKGIGSMPARGGDPSITDDELKDVILYMLKESGLELSAAEDKSEMPSEENTEAAPKEEAQEQTSLANEIEAESVPVDVVLEEKEKPAMIAAETIEAKVDHAAIEKAERLAKGKKVYDAACIFCHADGSKGSPKFGDKEAWASRLAQGKETLYLNALNGKGLMPPKGGASIVDDERIKAAVDYMLNEIE